MKTGIKTKKELESEFQDNVIKYIKSQGGYVKKIHVSAFQSKGISDLIVCYKGAYINLELKVGNNTASEIQKENLKQVIKAGGIGAVIYSIDDVKEILYEVSRIREVNKPNE